MSVPEFPFPQHKALDLRHWYGGWLGRRVYQSEARSIEEACGLVHGHQMLIHGAYTFWPGIENCPIPMRIILNDELHGVSGSRSMEAPIHELPIPAEELSAVVLAHSLEMEPDPYAVLREVDRVLVDDGYVVIVGFNPLSTWGLRKLGNLTGKGNSPWNLPYFTTHRVQDWLAVLGFQILRVEHTGMMLPFNIADNHGRLDVVEHLLAKTLGRLRGSYLMVARKRSVPMTTITPPWRQRRSLIPTGLAEPTAREPAPSNRTVH